MAHSPDPACAMAHGDLPPDLPPRTLVAVFTSSVADYLLHFGRDIGFRTVLLEPDSNRLAEAEWRYADHVATAPHGDFVDQRADVVITDHDRPELGDVLRAVLMLPARWVGVMGSLRHSAPHIEALRRLGVPDYVISRVHRPIGLNIGSRTPSEIAVSTLAGLIADRNGRPGGVSFGAAAAGAGAPGAAFSGGRSAPGRTAPRPGTVVGTAPAPPPPPPTPPASAAQPAPPAQPATPAGREGRRGRRRS